MANPQHIKWLLEGVEAWNTRRGQDDFMPDFEGVDIHGAFEAVGKLQENGRFDLSEADLGGPGLTGTNVQTVYPGLGINNKSTPGYTGLRTARDIMQDQLNSMRGDSGTLIPDDLTRLEHWPELENKQPNPQEETGAIPAAQTTETTSTTKPPSPSIALSAQINLILKTAPLAAQTADSVAIQIETAVQEFRSDFTGNDLPDEVILFENLAHTLRLLPATLSPETSDDDKIAQLTARVAELEEELAKLKETADTSKGDLALAREEFAKKFGGTLGVASATGIAAGLAYLIGPGGADALSALSDFLGLGTAPAAPPQTLPPTTTL